MGEPEKFKQCFFIHHTHLQIRTVMQNLFELSQTYLAWKLGWQYCGNRYILWYFQHSPCQNLAVHENWQNQPKILNLRKGSSNFLLYPDGIIIPQSSSSYEQ